MKQRVFKKEDIIDILKQLDNIDEDYNKFNKIVSDIVKNKKEIDIDFLLFELKQLLRCFDKYISDFESQTRRKYIKNKIIKDSIVFKDSLKEL